MLKMYFPLLLAKYYEATEISEVTKCYQKKKLAMLEVYKGHRGE